MKTNQVGVDVLVRGTRAGSVNTPIEVDCGTTFVALGRPQSDGTFQVVGEGKAASVACQAATTVEFNPAPSPAARPVAGAGPLPCDPPYTVSDEGKRTLKPYCL